MSTSPTFRSTTLVKFGLAAVLALAPVLAEAKIGGGSSSGSRGSRTQSAPAPTQTAPGVTQPMQRTTTPQQSTAPRPTAATPAPAQQKPGFFGGAFGKGLLGGLVGAGLIGLLAGNGFMGGFDGIMSALGMVLQVGLIVMLAMFLWSFFARRRQPDLAMQGAGMQRQAMGGVPPYPQGAAGGMGAAQAVKTVPIQLGEADFGMFERLLGEAQTAYANEDFARLKRLATDEMMYYFRDDIEAQKKRGLACRVSDVKLLQGDLSEAWREGADEYATVAMRFSMIDVKVDRNDGRVVEGDANRPVESTEVWTFVRPAGSGVNGWVLSAIQQTA